MFHAQLPALAKSNCASDCIVTSLTLNARIWDLMSFSHFSIGMHSNIVGLEVLGPQEPPTYVAKIHVAISAQRRLPIDEKYMSVPARI